MGDEISRCNEPRVECIPGALFVRWRATIGPDDGRGLVAWGHTATGALIRLAHDCERLGWCWDETWRDRG